MIFFKKDLERAHDCVDLARDTELDVAPRVREHQ